MTESKPGTRLSPRVGIPSVQLAVVPQMVRVTRGIQWGLLSVAVCSGLLTGWMGWHIHALEEESVRYAAAADRTASLNRRFTAELEQERLTRSAQEITAIQQEVLFINQLAEKRGFSWTQLLHDLEEALPAGTSITTIQRDAQRSTITIGGRATGMTVLNTLMAALQSRPAFRLPVLHHHKEIDSHSTGGEGARDSTGVEFSVTVQYQGLAQKAQADDVS